MGELKKKERHIKLGLCHSLNVAVSPEDSLPNSASKLMNINYFPECTAAHQNNKMKGVGDLIDEKQEWGGIG